MLTSGAAPTGEKQTIWRGEETFLQKWVLNKHVDKKYKWALQKVIKCQYLPQKGLQKSSASEKYRSPTI